MSFTEPVYLPGGLALIVSGAFNKSAHLCCCAPDDCPCTGQAWTDLYNDVTQTCKGLKRCYKLSSYSLGSLSLSGCSACTDTTYTSSADDWDGSFHIDTAECMWVHNGNGSRGGGANYFLNNDGSESIRLDNQGAPTDYRSYIKLINGASNYWELQIQCYTAGPIIWNGRAYSTTPVGTYTRQSGCDSTTTTLGVIECP